MESEDVKELKEDNARIAIRLDNVEGYFNNFDTTLNNHMTDYKKAQEDISQEQKGIREELKNLAVSIAKVQGSNDIVPLLVKYVIFPLILILGALAGVTLFLPGAV